MNPIWIKTIVDAVENSMKRCPHCKKVSAFSRKPDLFYTCRHCGLTFREKS